jgi:hypothetical protein
MPIEKRFSMCWRMWIAVAVLVGVTLVGSGDPARLAGESLGNHRCG